MGWGGGRIGGGTNLGVKAIGKGSRASARALRPWAVACGVVKAEGGVPLVLVHGRLPLLEAIKAHPGKLGVSSLSGQLNTGLK